jgi:hypothetical protein
MNLNEIKEVKLENFFPHYRLLKFYVNFKKWLDLNKIYIINRASESI